jgi:hypothetical protein
LGLGRQLNADIGAITLSFSRGTALRRLGACISGGPVGSGRTIAGAWATAISVRATLTRRGDLGRRSAIFGVITTIVASLRAAIAVIAAAIGHGIARARAVARAAIRHGIAGAVVAIVAAAIAATVGVATATATAAAIATAVAAAVAAAMAATTPATTIGVRVVSHVAVFRPERYVISDYRGRLSVERHD